MSEFHIYALLFIATVALGLHSNMDRNNIGNAAQIKLQGPAVLLLLLFIPINLGSIIGTLAVLIWSMWKLSFFYTALAAALALVALIAFGFPLHRHLYPWLRGEFVEDRFLLSASLNLFFKLISIGSIVAVALQLWVS